MNWREYVDLAFAQLVATIVHPIETARMYAEEHPSATLWDGGWATLNLALFILHPNIGGLILLAILGPHAFAGLYFYWKQGRDDDDDDQDGDNFAWVH